MHSAKKYVTGLAVATLASGLVAASAFAYTEKKVEKGGNLKGVVKYSQDMTKANQKNTDTKDPESCGADRMKPELMVDAGTKGLVDAVVYFKKVETGKPWTDAQKKVTLDQKTCAFDKHVTLVAEGGEVTFKNSDSVLHNISAKAVLNKSFNEGVGAGKEMTKKFEKPEFVPLSCSVHPWMNATIVVMAHPYYAVTDAKGAYSITDIPPGKYTVLVQHQELKKIDNKGEDIEVKEGDNTKDFEYK